MHIPQIKAALGISGVSTTYSAWTKKADDEEGMQIDLLLTRRDNIVNMCEIKYYSDAFVVNQEYYRTILRRQTYLLQHVSPKVSVHNTLITTFGIVNNKYSGVFTNIITLGDLFS